MIHLLQKNTCREQLKKTYYKRFHVCLSTKEGTTMTDISNVRPEKTHQNDRKTYAMNIHLA
jgi:hypothetical protein